MRREDTFEEYLKTVIPATKEEREYMERAKKRPLPPPEQIETQLRASGAFRGTQPNKRETDSKSGPDKNQGSWDRNRKVLDYPIFKPLLQVLLPALTADAEEIQIGYSRRQPEGIRGAYTKNGKSFPLAIEPRFHWGDVFARVKIIAGLSILPEKHQRGEISLEFNDRVILFSMETTETEKEHTLRLKRAAQG